MSSLNFLEQTYGNTVGDLFKIPEEVIYPIFNDQNAREILDFTPEVGTPVAQNDKILGEKELKLTDEQSNFPRNYFDDQDYLNFDCFSPKLDEAEEDFENALQIHEPVRKRVHQVCPDNLQELTCQKLKKNESYNSANELTNEVSSDCDLKTLTNTPPRKELRYARSAFGPKTENCDFGVNSQNRRRSQRSKGHMLESMDSEEVSSNSGKGISLAKRKDVVNKTLLRSAKRYYTNLFDRFIRENHYSKQEKREFWKLYIQDFSKALFKDLGEVADKGRVTTEDVNAFMAAMIVPNYVKRADQNDVYSEVTQEFSDLLYKYSIKRLNTFVSNVNVGYVLKQFVEGGALKSLLDDDVTLSKNRGLYIKAAKEIVKLSK
jgi:hypothetical protein